MFYTYILQSLVCGRYYIGSCDSIENRFKQHNDGKVKAFIPWKLMYQRKFKTRKDAVAREYQLKSWKSRDALERLIKRHF